jgi:hypothetical protein
VSRECFLQAALARLEAGLACTPAGYYHMPPGCSWEHARHLYMLLAAAVRHRVAAGLHANRCFKMKPWVLFLSVGLLGHCTRTLRVLAGGLPNFGSSDDHYAGML